MRTIKFLFLFLLMIAICISILTSCKQPSKPLKKPFVITGKCNDCSFIYYAQDANGMKFGFDDYIDKYSIGDTIK